MSNFLSICVSICLSVYKILVILCRELLQFRCYCIKALQMSDNCLIRFGIPSRNTLNYQENIRQYLMFYIVSIFQDLESYLSQHTSENRATIEELKQEMIVNSILSDLVKKESENYVKRYENLESQVTTVFLLINGSQVTNVFLLINAKQIIDREPIFSTEFARQKNLSNFVFLCVLEIVKTKY